MAYYMVSFRKSPRKALNGKTEESADGISRPIKKRPLTDFFGILSGEEGDSLAKAIEEGRKTNRILQASRERRLWGSPRRAPDKKG